MIAPAIWIATTKNDYLLWIHFKFAKWAIDKWKVSEFQRQVKKNVPWNMNSELRNKKNGSKILK